MAHTIEATGLIVGVLFGLAAMATRTGRRGPADSRLVTQTGWAYAGIWAAMALRMGFTYGSTHWFAHPPAHFSTRFHVPAAAYASAFVLMVVAMIAVRTTSVWPKGRSQGATIDRRGTKAPR